jgi:hypothetical protein
MPINRAPTKTLAGIPKFRLPEWAVGAPSVAARLSCAVARFMQSLLLALHESRFERAQREIDGLRHLLPKAEEVTRLHAHLRCGGGDRREPARRPAEARGSPLEAA